MAVFTLIGTIQAAYYTVAFLSDEEIDPPDTEEDDGN
jgi:hypothetical protein